LRKGSVKSNREKRANKWKFDIHMCSNKKL